ncbi:MAG TPA: hypothetical protein VG456_14785 [Candidatus Sulfopaludibacter sp.]|jgi:hypothetical protein|nr:hypothetical protein [Candidatus Sulfopaludibacter sp.]
MMPLTIALASLSLLTLTALILSATAFFQARSIARAAARAPEPVSAEADPAIQGLRHDLDGLAAQIHAMQQLPMQNSAPAPPRGGLNLAKRSQALRLHRHGNPAGQIASVLDIPLQEVELLLKVHQIVISNLQN